MSLSDLLSGKVGYFNSITVPVYNEISQNIIKTCNAVEQSFFGVVCLYGVAQKMIDLFFKPGPNSLIETIREYNQEDMRNLYSIFMIWMFYDLINFLGDVNKDNMKDKLKNILNLDNEKFEYYFKNLEHGKEIPVNLEKIWGELILIIKSLTNTPENFLVFRREFANKKNEALKAFNQN